MAEDSDDDDATAVVTGGGVVWADPDAGEMPAETGALPWVKRLVRAPRLCEHNCLRPAELHHFKVLRQDVYDHVIADLFGDEPPSIDTPLNAHNGFCRQCAAADAGERANATAEYDRRRALREAPGVGGVRFPKWHARRREAVPRGAQEDGRADDVKWRAERLGRRLQRED